MSWFRNCERAATAIAAANERGGKPNTTKMEFLEERLEYFIDDYSKKRNGSRDTAATLQKITIIMSVLVTLILGVKTSPVLPDGVDQYFHLLH
jgi:hypothetical protein